MLDLNANTVDGFPNITEEPNMEALSLDFENLSNTDVLSSLGNQMQNPLDSLNSLEKLDMLISTKDLVSGLLRGDLSEVAKQSVSIGGEFIDVAQDMELASMADAGADNIMENANNIKPGFL